VSAAQIHSSGTISTIAVRSAYASSIRQMAISTSPRGLRDVGVLEAAVVEPGNRVRGSPYKFCQLTDDARALFDRNNLLLVDTWRRQYARVEKSGEITELEEMLRPE